MALEIHVINGQVITTGSGEATSEYFDAVNAVRAVHGQHQEGAEEYFGHYDEIANS
jgi:hypothetical protein